MFTASVSLYTLTNNLIRTKRRSEALRFVTALALRSSFSSDSPVQRCCGGGEIDSVEAKKFENNSDQKNDSSPELPPTSPRRSHQRSYLFNRKMSFVLNPRIADPDVVLSVCPNRAHQSVSTHLVSVQNQRYLRSRESAQVSPIWESSQSDSGYPSVE